MRESPKQFQCGRVLAEDKILAAHFAGQRGGSQALRMGRATDGPILAYTMLATFVTAFRWGEAFAFMAHLHQK